MAGKSMLMLFPPERVMEEEDIIARIKRAESIDHFETVRVRKHGKHIDVSVTHAPIADEEGKIIGAIGCSGGSDSQDELVSNAGAAVI